jgi:hypothetical protein
MEYSGWYCSTRSACRLRLWLCVFILFIFVLMIPWIVILSPPSLLRLFSPLRLVLRFVATFVGSFRAVPPTDGPYGHLLLPSELHYRQASYGGARMQATLNKAMKQAWRHSYHVDHAPVSWPRSSWVPCSLAKHNYISIHVLVGKWKTTM